jgi:Na+/H+-dicarboxylate symporter
MKSKGLTQFIFIAMLLGIGVGYVLNTFFDTAPAYQDNITLVSSLFLRLIKMIIAPLVASTLIVGIAKLGDMKVVGRIGLKTMAWFLFATVISLSLGMVLVNFFKPGAGLNLPLPSQDTVAGIAKAKINPKDFLTHLVPDSFFMAMSGNEILQIIVFSIFFGMACASLPEQTHGLVNAIESISKVMLKITGYVMNMAPLAVFAAISAIIAKSGLGVLITYGKLIGEFYLGLFLLWVILYILGSLWVGKRIKDLFFGVKESVLLAFSTASSESAFPQLMQQLEKFGCQKKIVSFTLPLGYSFNLDGSMMYMTFASLFIAQAYHIEMPLYEQISLLLTLMVTSKGIAGVPRASLVVISGALAQFHIPEAGLLLLMGIDQLLDMGRSATNVIGNAVATVAVSKWENELSETNHG